MSLADELVKSVLPKRERKSGAHDHPHTKLWNSIEKDFRDLQHLRRRIAHHPVALQQTTYLPLLLPATPSWFEIYVSQNERLRLRDSSANLKPLRIEDLSRHHIELKQLTRRLSEFCHETLPTHVAK
jgi:hypothetical protein